MSEPTSGTALVDELLDGVRIGDNLVLVGAEGTPIDLLVDRFSEVAAEAGPLVVVNVAEAWGETTADADTIVLDWSAALSGEETPGGTAANVRRLPATADLSAAIASLHEADDQVGEGAAFVFDRLTAVEQVWGPDAPSTLFLAACPRLYRRRSLALWPIDRDAHRPSFLRRLTEITQVVVELETSDDHTTLTVRKADGRDPSVVGRSIRAEVVDGDLVATGARTTVREQLGSLIREQRLASGLSQADVARRVGITPSALSQVERGVRGPSGDTLMRLWEVLGVPFGPTTRSPDDRGYLVARRSGRERTELQPGLSAERVLGGDVEQWLVQVAPQARGDRAPFAVKRSESAVVLRGVLEVTLDGRVETLHEGDGLVVDDAVVSGWANPSSAITELLWSLHPAR